MLFILDIQFMNQVVHVIQEMKLFISFGIRVRHCVVIDVKGRQDCDNRGCQ
jgi:hypothetical protein